MASLASLGVVAAYSPEDCGDATIAAGHVSLIGIRRETRSALLALVERGLVRPPVVSS